MVAVAWHQIGVIYKNLGDYVAAEQAYQNSIQIERILGNLNGLAGDLNELGSLYKYMERYEEAVRFHREATTIYVDLKDSAREGITRSNMALALLALQRYDEARRELQRAILCKAPFGHSLSPWTTFALLYDLEQSIGNESAAQEVWQQAVEAYMAYRRDGGRSTDEGDKAIAHVAQALVERQIVPIAAELEGLMHNPEISNEGKSLVRVVQQIVSGERDPALANNPELYYKDAVELRLMLETLTQKEAALSRPSVAP